MSNDSPATTRAPRAAGASPPGPATTANRVAHVVEIMQTVLTGLVLALIFRAFLVEPFIIPTGSMANALLGAHATKTCPACGWEFSFAPLRAAASSGQGFVCPPETMCPNCQLRLQTVPEATLPRSGDRIVVHKWAYAIGGPLGPCRWDVIVFRDPADPERHYIKRLIGLPGESVEIVDGDVFINGRVARKPRRVQEALWLVVFDQAHLATATAASGRLPRWVVFDPPRAGARGWTGLDQRVIRYDGLDQTPRTMVFNHDTGSEYLLDFCAYNRHSSGAFVGDVRLIADVTLEAGTGWLRWELDRPPRKFSAELRADGTVRLDIRPASHAQPELTQSGTVNALPVGRPLAVEFGHVDYRVYISIDGREVVSTGDEYVPAPEALSADPGPRPVGLSVCARNLRLTLRGLRIDRDIHYTCDPRRTKRAATGEPFELRAGEYFVLGDNSPDSHDSREWTEVDIHLPEDYRPGTVRADQIVGQAAFVYLPGLLPLDAAGRWWIPDLGRVRFIR